MKTVLQQSVNTQNILSPICMSVIVIGHADLGKPLQCLFGMTIIKMYQTSKRNNPMTLRDAIFIVAFIVLLAILKTIIR